MEMENIFYDEISKIMEIDKMQFALECRENNLDISGYIRNDKIGYVASVKAIIERIIRNDTHYLLRFFPPSIYAYSFSIQKETERNGDIFYIVSVKNIQSSDELNIVMYNEGNIVVNDNVTSYSEMVDMIQKAFLKYRE